MANGNNIQSEAIPPVSEETPLFRNIYIDNIQCRGARRAMLFDGLPEMNISNIRISNASIISNKGVMILESDGVKLNNLKLDVLEGPAVVLHNVKNTVISHIIANLTSGADTVKISGEKTMNIDIQK
jgi:hypothetical protein